MGRGLGWGNWLWKTTPRRAILNWHSYRILVWAGTNREELYMSGSGGGGSWRPSPKPVTPPRSGGGGGSGGRPIPAPCDITEKTNLNSVDRNVLSTIRLGQILEVVFEIGPPRRLVAQAPAGIVGAITSPSMPQIIQCITQGNHAYVAEVLSIRGGICEVEIRPR